MSSIKENIIKINSLIILILKLNLFIKYKKKRELIKEQDYELHLILIDSLLKKLNLILINQKVNISKK